MEYLFAEICVSPYSEDIVDVLNAMLGEIDYDTFENTENGVRAYIQKDKFDKSGLQSVLDNFFIPGFSFTYTIQELENKDWNEEWEKASFSPVLEERFGIRLNPRMAFGSGSHETTFMLTEYLMSKDFAGKRVLDMGCGTGVLGIAMAKKGASVVAIDIDDMSVANACENFSLNGLEYEDVIHGDASAINGMYDVVVANIHKNILKRDIEIYNTHMNSGALLLMSGFFKEDVEEMEAVAEGHGFVHCDVLSKNEWAAIVVRKG